MVDALRAAGEHEVGELAAAVGEAAQVTSGRPVLELELDLLHRRARPARASIVIRVSTPNPLATGKDRLARLRTQPALARERLAHRPPAGGADERAGGALGEPEAPA